MTRPALALLLPLLATSARADGPATLRFATVAPDGSSWAREIKAVTRSVEDASAGQLRIRWYWNGVAGEESEVAERMQRGQIDGVASGQIHCERVAPSFRILRVPGLFRDRDEAADVASRLQPTFEAEAHEAGVMLPAGVGLGADIIFTRNPVHSMAELRQLKLWRRSGDIIGIETSRAMGLQIVPLPLSEGARAFDAGQIDGFIAIPAAALTFQWFTRARYVIDLSGNTFLWGCIIIDGRSFARLSVSQQNLLREAAAKMGVLVDRDGRRLDEQLLGGLFQRQGVQVIKVSDAFRAEFMDAARHARDATIDRQLIPKSLLTQTMSLLADHRAEYH
jgi:TRAP-type C4-dicarboxylate transport system substrate-binding protein